MASARPTDETTHQAEPGDRLIAPGHDFGSVTDKISSIVLQRKTPLGWFVGFGDRVLRSSSSCCYAMANLLVRRHRGLGHQRPRRAGASTSSTSSGGSASATRAR